LKQFDPIPYAFTSNYNIIIRYLSLNKVVLAMEKINLRQLVNLFIADGFYKYQTNYMNSKLQLSDLSDLCNFVIYKIKSANFGSFLNIT